MYIATNNLLDIYSTKPDALTAKLTQQMQSVTFNVKINLDASILDNAVSKAKAEAAIRSDFCFAANIPLVGCHIYVVIKSAGVSADVTVLSNDNNYIPTPIKIAQYLSAQVTNPNSLLRSTPTVGLIESPQAFVITNSTLRGSSASTASVAVATTAVVAGLAAVFLL